MAGINHWRELKVWQKGHQLALLIYTLSSDFPAHEKFALTSQMRRAVVSVTSNIVEGFQRRSVRESLNFYNISSGSLEETRYQLLLAKDLNYLSEPKYKQAEFLAEEVSKLLHAWSNSQRRNSE